MTNIPPDQGRRVKLGKLKAKLAREKSPEQKEKLRARIQQEEGAPPVGLLEEGKRTDVIVGEPDAVKKPLDEKEFTEMVDSVFSALELTGVPLKTSDLSRGMLTDGFTKIAKRKGWNTETISEWGLIGMGAGLIIVQSLPLWIQMFKKKKEESDEKPQVQPNPPGRPDGLRQDNPG